MNAYRNVCIYFAFLIPASAFAFWKTYFGRLNNIPETATLLIHGHALLMVLWLFMLTAQSWFIRTNRFQLHKFVGRSSFMIAPLIIVSIFLVMHEMFNRTPDGVPIEIARLNVLGFGQVSAFGISWILAMVYRRKPSMHVRFIISSVLAMSTAIVFRIFSLWLSEWFPVFSNPEAATAGNCAVINFTFRM